MINYTELNVIMENEYITTLFQPIVRLHDGSIIGYEALSRGFNNAIIYSPLDLIELAKRENKIFELEMLFRKKAIESFANYNLDTLLFLNVEPDIINDEHFEKGHTKCVLDKYNININKIVFEVTERTAIENYTKYKKVINNYKDQGYLLAVDDVGSGYAGLNRVAVTEPTFLKVDMDLIRDINKDVFKQALMEAIVSFAGLVGIKVIAEGIETKDELNLLRELGVFGGQGFYLAKPSKEPCNQRNINWPNKLLRIIESA